MIISAHLCQERIGVYFRGRSLDHGSDDNRMMISSRCLYHESAKYGTIKIREFKKFDIRCVIEGNFNDRSEAGSNDSCADPP